jgi:hypothetical protein
MTRTFQHARASVFLSRKVVPADVRVLIEKRELKEMLETKDHRVAKEKGALFIARFDALI